jgi:hypothetical protein
MQPSKTERATAAIGFVMILCGLLANPWFLVSITRLTNGQTSFLRIIVLVIFDISAISAGVYWITHRKSLVFNAKRYVFSAVTLVIALFTIEIVLVALTKISPTVRHLLSAVAIPEMIDDGLLGHRPNPEFPEHDARGFRNKIALEQAEIVAIGDSQTYGTGVRRYQAWPQQLSVLSGRSVYNMSYGGYGSVEALVLLEEAKKLNPQLVVFAMYNGNDLVDAFDAAYNLNIHPELKSEGSQTILIEEMERTSPLIKEMKKITARMWGGQPKSEEATSAVNTNKPSFAGKIKKIKLFRLFFAVELMLQNTVLDADNRRLRAAMQLKTLDSDIIENFDIKDFSTLFTPAYRRIAMNLEDPRIAEGLAISLEAINLMKRNAEANGMDFLVILISTKERTFYELYPNYGLEPSESMQWLVTQENLIRDRTESYLKQNDIDYIDMVPLLRGCFVKGQQPYFRDADGHLNAVGQHEVAQAVNTYLKEKQKTKAQY